MDRPDAFEKYALEYDQWFETHEAEYELELNAIREMLPKQGRGVEIGAGTGRFSRPLGISLGIEPAKSMRDIASRRGVNIIDGKAESLPIEDASYNFALLTTTVCFLDSPETAFREVHRVLEPGGYIIIGLIDRNSKLGRTYEARKSESRFYRDATFHSVDEIRNELTKAGFGNLEYLQTLLPGANDEAIKPGLKQGYGEGSFVVIRAQRNAT
jgi:SAM-dependent methyltransferase